MITFVSAQRDFAGKKTTGGPIASRISRSAALVEGSDVRLSSRKAACSSVAPQRSTGNPGWACTLCKIALAFELTLLVASPAFAQHQTFALNPAASDIKMTLKTTHEVVDGMFHVASGSIDYDRSAPTMSGSVVVAAGSGKTGNDSRDKKMNKDVLKVQQYTTISFTPKSYTGTIAASGDSTIQVSGVFTLLGTPHDITVPMQVHIDGTSCTAKAHFMIPYVEWGLKNPSFLIWKADNDVAIDLSLVGRLSS